MLIKRHFLDLNPKQVKSDPLKLKSLLTNKTKSTVYRKAEEKPKILPMRLDSAKTQMNSGNPYGRTYHAKIQKNVRELEYIHKYKDPALTTEYYRKVIEDKVFVDNKLQKRYNSASVNRQTSGYRRFKELFVIPKIHDYEHFRESVSKLNVGNERSVKKENKQETYNPQFILKQQNKTPDLLRAFNTISKTNKDRFTISSVIGKQMSDNKRTLGDLKMLRKSKRMHTESFDYSREVPERPKTSIAFNFEKKFKNNRNFRYLTAKPITSKLKETLDLKNKFRKNTKVIDNDIRNIDIKKIYYNKHIRIETNDLSLFAEDFRKLEKEASLNIKEKQIRNHLNFVKKFEDLKKYKKALHYLKKIYHCSVFDELGSFKSFILNHLAYCLFEMKNYNPALELNKRLIDSNDNTYRLISLFNIIICCRSLRATTHEKYFIKQYIKEAEREGQSQHIFFSLAQRLIFYVTHQNGRKSDEILDVS